MNKKIDERVKFHSKITYKFCIDQIHSSWFCFFGVGVDGQNHTARKNLHSVMCQTCAAESVVA